VDAFSNLNTEILDLSKNVLSKGSNKAVSAKTVMTMTSSSNSSVKSVRDSIKSIKIYFYNVLNDFLMSPKLKKELINTYYNESIDMGNNEINKKPIDYESSSLDRKYLPLLLLQKGLNQNKGKYLEYYTLSKLSNKGINSIISENMTDAILNLKSLKEIYKIILQNLSDVFFKLFLKNASYALKSILYTKYKPNTDSMEMNSYTFNQSFKFNQNEEPLNLFLKKDGLKQFKDSLGIFYSVANKKIKVNPDFVCGADSFRTSDLKLEYFNSISSPFLSKKETLFDLVPLNKVKRRNEYSFKMLEPLNKEKSFNKNGFTSSSATNQNTKILNKKLYNNIYCLSHRERWEVENDWNFLYYFMTAPFLDGQLIPNYKIRYQNGYGTEFSNTGNDYDYDETLTYQNISFDYQKSAFFSGPGIVQQLLTEFNFYEIKKMDKQNRILLYQLNKQIFKLKKHSKHERSAKKELRESYKKRDLLIRRTKLVRKLFLKESAPQATILTVLPVLPPDLRPIVKMGGQIAASDLNRLYQRVIYRNDRLKKFLKDPATSHSYEMKYAQRLLQEAVDNLIQNGKSGVVSEKDSRGRALKSLSDILKGKQGRFRQYLLGKRVDYSGRSVIVVGPRLKLHECGLPKEMALELYLPFLLKRILNENLAKTVVGAKTLIKTSPSLVWELLREIMQTCPVLLNRAPTLHRLGIQSFQPKLIDGRAILLHPLVCSAFNADFDGDQMAVHVPITVEARAEAWKLMLSRNNILSPATGDPLAIPSQDMVLGCYYLTTNLLNVKTQDLITRKGSGSYFSNINEALRDYELKKIDLHSNIWLKWDAFVENGSDQEEPIEIRVDLYGNWKEIYNKSQKTYNSKNQRSSQYILTTPGKILFNQIIHKSLKVQRFQ
jgi:DNA-directed RNA polymerase beta' subunit